MPFRDKMTMKLERFSSQHYDLLIGWIHSEEQMYLWSGPTYSFPLNVSQIKAHCSKPEVNPFILFNGSQPVGFVELYKITKHHYRVCRVLIAQEYRGNGLSKTMLNLVINKAVDDFGTIKLSLGVFERNQVAQRCYQDIGFKVVSFDRGSRVVNGEPWTLVHMEKSLITKRLRNTFNAWRFWR